MKAREQRPGEAPAKPSGRATKPNVLLIHGAFCGPWSLEGLQKKFEAAGYRCKAPALRFHDGARPPAALGTTGLADYAGDLLEEIRALDSAPILVGHSMGGLLAQTLLRRGPRAYRAAVLSCTSPAFGDRSGEFQKKFVADRLGPLDAGRTMAELAPAMVASVTGPAPDPVGRQLAIETIAATSERSYRAAVHCLVHFDERANLACITVPVLCLAGEHDRLAPPAMMERMAARIPGARYVCLKGVGHLPNIEAAQAFDGAVLDFLRAALASAAA